MPIKSIENFCPSSLVRSGCFQSRRIKNWEWRSRIRRRMVLMGRCYMIMWSRCCIQNRVRRFIRRYSVCLLKDSFVQMILRITLRHMSIIVQSRFILCGFCSLGNRFKKVLRRTNRFFRLTCSSKKKSWSWSLKLNSSTPFVKPITTRSKTWVTSSQTTTKKVTAKSSTITNQSDHFSPTRTSKTWSQSLTSRASSSSGEAQSNTTPALSPKNKKLYQRKRRRWYYRRLRMKMMMCSCRMLRYFQMRRIDGYKRRLEFRIVKLL